MKNIFLSVSVLVLSLFYTSQAIVLNNYAHEKEDVIITDQKVYNDDYLFLGHELNFSGEAEDLIFLGKRLNFDGTTKQGAFSLCERAVYQGISNNGIMTGAGSIVINGKVYGSSFFLCKSIDINDSAVIQGTVFMAGARFTLNGKLNGDLYAGAGEIIINNEINGNVKVYGGRITFGEKGKINGNLTYGSKEKLDNKFMSRITGTVTIDKKLECEMNNSAFDKTLKSIGYFLQFALYISFILLSLLLLFVPAFSYLDKKQTSKEFWNTLLWGLIPVLMYPAMIILSLIMIFSIPFAVIMLLSIIPLLFFANILGTTLFGKYLISVFKWNIVKRHYQFLIGALAALILSIIPIVNILSFLFIISLGTGVFTQFLLKRTALSSNVQ